MLGSREGAPAHGPHAHRSQRTALAVAAAAEKGVRRWRRYQAVLLLGEGQDPIGVAHTLRCSRASVYAWRRLGAKTASPGSMRPMVVGGSNWMRRGRRCCRTCWPSIRRPAAIRPRGGRCPYCRVNWRRPGMRSESAPSVVPCTASATAGSGRSTCWDGLIRPTPKKGGGNHPGAGHARGGWGGLGGR